MHEGTEAVSYGTLRAPASGRSKSLRQSSNAQPPHGCLHSVGCSGMSLKSGSLRGEWEDRVEGEGKGLVKLPAALECSVSSMRTCGRGHWAARRIRSLRDPGAGFDPPPAPGPAPSQAARGRGAPAPCGMPSAAASCGDCPAASPPLGRAGQFAPLLAAACASGCAGRRQRCQPLARAAGSPAGLLPHSWVGV